MIESEELKMMTNEPKQLFEIYLAQLVSGVPLSDSQISKFEYLKKLFVKEE